MAKKTADFNPVKTGADPRKDSEGGQSWMKIEPNSQEDVVSLVNTDEIISCEQCAIWLEDGNSPVWVYTGPDDPSHELKIDKRYRAYLPVLTSEGEVKVWSMGKGAHGQLMDIADAGGDLKGMELRIKRTGAGLATRYSIVPRGKRKDVSRQAEVDVIALLGPITPDEVKEMIAERLNLPDYEAVLEKHQGKKIFRASKKSKEVAPVRGRHASTPHEDDDEEEDLDDAEL